MKHVWVLVSPLLLAIVTGLGPDHGRRTDAASRPAPPVGPRPRRPGSPPPRPRGLLLAADRPSSPCSRARRCSPAARPRGSRGHPERRRVLQDQQHRQQRRARGRAARLPPRREGDGDRDPAATSPGPCSPPSGGSSPTTAGSPGPSSAPTGCPDRRSAGPSSTARVPSPRSRTATTAGLDRDKVWDRAVGADAVPAPDVGLRRPRRRR